MLHYKTSVEANPRQLRPRIRIACARSEMMSHHAIKLATHHFQHRDVFLNIRSRDRRFEISMRYLVAPVDNGIDGVRAVSASERFVDKRPTLAYANGSHQPVDFAGSRIGEALDVEFGVDLTGSWQTRMIVLQEGMRDTFE